jgi:PleD family two-component response regulator
MKILLAEDEAVSRSALSRLLERWGYEVVLTTDGAAAWHVLQQPEPPQLALLDWMMPGIDGLRLCQAVRQHRPEPYIYLLLLTAKNRRADLIAGLEAGADDYVTKPFDSQELRVRLHTGQRIISLQTDLICDREAQRILATHDALTGVFNRGAILESWQFALVRVERDGQAVRAFLVDLDLC